MSFKEITSNVAIANRALGMIAESKTLSSIDDGGHNAQAVRRWYKPVVARLLELHHWGLATKHASLVRNLTNNRGTEWSYSFAPPIDMAFPVGIGLENGGSSVSYYTGLSGLLAMSQGKAIFQHHNGVLYSNLVGDLEYVSYEITEADFTATFENIVILMLASRLALEIPKDPDMSKSLEDAAKMEINVAMAANLNAGNRKYGQNVSEAELVRGSGFSNWDYFPRALGW